MRFSARRRWMIQILSSFNRAEFAKLAFIPGGKAHFLSRRPDELAASRGIFWKGIGLLLPAVRADLKEPDLGSALVCLPTGW